MGRNRTQEGIAPIRDAKLRDSNIKFSSKLPYYHCRISLTNTLKEPSVSCDALGNIFSTQILLAFVKKYGKNPLTGEEMKLSEIIPIHFFVENEQILCPITRKSLMTDKVKVGLIRTTGNVYAYDTIDEMNIKSKYYQDLLTGSSFNPKKDIILLQDPEKKSDLLDQSYWYIEHRINWKALLDPFQESTLSSQSQSQSQLSITSAATRRILKEMEEIEKREEREKRELKELKEKKSAPQKMLYSTNLESSASASLTSTSVTVKTSADTKELTEKELQYKRIHDKNLKGYARMNTTLGPIDIELFTHLAPKACENFIVHSKNNYYNQTIFHRIIAGFMAQGGDPSGTGRGGKSIWGDSFEDEFDDTLKFNSRGLVACANKGPNTNGSQFFITFSPSHHLDNKHTIFGKVIDGEEIMNKLETTKTRENNRPIDPPKIIDIIITIDPFEIDTKKQEKKKRRQAIQEEKKEEDSKIGGWFSAPQPQLSAVRTGIGKYLPKLSTPSSTSSISSTSSTTSIESSQQIGSNLNTINLSTTHLNTTTNSNTTHLNTTTNSNTNNLKRKEHPTQFSKELLLKRNKGQFDFSNW